MRRRRQPEPKEHDAFKEVLDVNERILREIHEIYTTVAPGAKPAGTAQPKLAPAELQPGREGIVWACRKLGLPCIPPRRKINVMIIGNHSAGKSSYINWYVGETVLKAAVAVETQFFTFCTSGKKRETLKGQATLQLFDELQHDLHAVSPTIFNALQTEVSTSKERCFNLLTLIDTPGLVDGSFEYPFPVEEVIDAIADHCDLIYIFFDPHGQALCDRTMNVIERLNKEHAEKMRYFLSKADMVQQERDRQKVVVQITQNLSSRIRNKHAFELPSLYIPDKAAPGFNKIDNALDQTCEEMEQTVNASVQNNLDKLEADCKLIAAAIDTMLVADLAKRKKNSKRFAYGGLCFLLSFLPPLIAALYLLNDLPLSWRQAVQSRAPQLAEMIGAACDAIRAVSGAGGSTEKKGPSGGRVEGAGIAGKLALGVVIFFFVMQVCSRLLRSYAVVYSKRELNNLRLTREHATNTLLEKKARLYQQYLDQCRDAPATAKPAAKTPTV